MARWLIVLAMILAPRFAAAEPFETSFAIGRRHIPLPPGQWEPLTRIRPETHIRRDGDGLNAVPIVTHRVALVQKADGRAVALVVIAVQTEPGIFATPRGVCGGGLTSYGSVATTAYLEREAHSLQRGDLDCRAIGITTPADTTLEHLQPLYAHQQNEHRYLPDRWLSVSILRSKQPNTIEVEYHFDPTHFAPQTNGKPGGWSRGMLGPERRAILARLWAWSNDTREAIDVALAGRHPTEPLAPFPRD